MKIVLPKFTIVRMFFVVIIIPTAMVFVTIATMHHDPREYKVTEEVYLEIEMDGKPLGKMVFALFGEDVPLTVNNFVTFATRGFNDYSYKGSAFHRVIKQFMIQGGDVVSGDGKGSISIYGHSFPDERLDIKHATPGFISMANTDC
ncbi:peptidyl-prolyl cis-trans isomerase B-like isoform X2 [Homarus americanus]|uniref:peptidyl-prolyl cis-trans isomerase B-like isoform X2 n=1 Tax=Homarus americanus TaxID=6706 RepID=UPI001C476B27|nr:peptidyl-prolyl cis-trans isomerase B-like isoform X2 [Homarus americanus]